MIIKTFIISTLIFLVSCSHKTLENQLGIKGKLEKLTVITSRIKQDSIGNTFKDTATVMITKVDKNGNAKQVVSNLYLNNKVIETTISDMIYNSSNQVKKELVKTLKEPVHFEVNYLYIDSLLDKIISNTCVDSIMYEHAEKYKYNEDGKLCIRQSTMLNYDMITNDTLSLNTATFHYDENEFQISSEWRGLYDDSENVNEFYTNDSLGLLIREVSVDNYTLKSDTTTYSYEFDNKGNWITRKALQENKLIKITQRIIE